MTALTVRLVSLGALVFLMGGCATITNDQQHKLSISSNPSGATVSINGQEVGTTPVTIPWERQGNDLDVRVSKKGYKTAEGTMRAGIDPIFWGNIVFGGVIGSTTDAATGKMYEYEPDRYHFTLEPKDQASIDAWRERQEIVRYILVSGEPLSNDIRRGQGPYLSTLYRELGVSAEQRPAALAAIQSMKSVSSGPVEFSREVLSLYQR